MRFRWCVLVLLLTTLMGWATPCTLSDQPFLLMETGVSGGIALVRESVLLVLPTPDGAARVLLRQQRDGRTYYGQAVQENYQALADELSSLGAWALPHPAPTSADLDPYGLKIALHLHDGNHCYAYSPQRDCSLMNGPKASLTPAQRETFRAVADRLAALQNKASSQLTESEFRAAEQSLWRSR